MTQLQTTALCSAMLALRTLDQVLDEAPQSVGATARELDMLLRADGGDARCS